MSFNSFVIIWSWNTQYRMLQRKWRETKQQSRARSGRQRQLSCCLISLHFLCDIPSRPSTRATCFLAADSTMIYKSEDILPKIGIVAGTVRWSKGAVTPAPSNCASLGFCHYLREQGRFSDHESVLKRLPCLAGHTVLTITAIIVKK